MKKYYSYLDTGMVQHVPQPLQHQTIHALAARLDGVIQFYYMEEFRTLKSQKLLRSKIPMMQSADGIIFFSIQQFCYGKSINVKLMSQILDLGLELHFVKENISLLDKENFSKVLDFLLVVDHTIRNGPTFISRSLPS